MQCNKSKKNTLECSAQWSMVLAMAQCIGIPHLQGKIQRCTMADYNHCNVEIGSNVVFNAYQAKWRLSQDTVRRTWGLLLCSLCRGKVARSRRRDRGLHHVVSALGVQLCHAHALLHGLLADGGAACNCKGINRCWLSKAMVGRIINWQIICWKLSLCLCLFSFEISVEGSDKYKHIMN